MSLNHLANYASVDTTYIPPERCKVTEKLIARVELAVDIGADVNDVIAMLAENGVTGYDAWLAWKAAEVSQKMWEKKFR